MATGKEISKWADEAMFSSEPMPEEFDGQVHPRVYLLAGPEDPLGQIAATSMMYEGKVIRDLSEIDDNQRKHYFEQIKKTHLKMPFETVNLHFLVEGVTRSFTHQLVRQRTAAYAQESMRFAVVENEDLNQRVPLPPSLIDLAPDSPAKIAWENAVKNLGDTYTALVSSGIPAEDARGLLPHAVTTRIHYITNLRGLQDHLGNRLCTQAQFEWRMVAAGIISALRDYGSSYVKEANKWQYFELASMFRPICYLTGKCEFKASFDRFCSIRKRVDSNAAIGRPSSEWHTDTSVESGEKISSIQPSEWFLDPSSARQRS